MKDSWIEQVGIWGQMHYQYLKENQPTTVNVMRINGNLKSYLREVDEQAEQMIFIWQRTRVLPKCSKGRIRWYGLGE